VAARAIWKGVVRFGGVELPVKLYSAVEDRKVHFRLLSPKTKQPIRQRMVDPESEEEVPSEEIRKGYEAEPGRFVVFEDEELEALRPEPSREIEVTRFVEEGAIHSQWYDRAYFLGPDPSGDGAGGDYWALAAALEKSGREGVARWVMRNKAYAGALRSDGTYLMLVTLRRAGEVISARDLEAPSGPKLEERELRLAERLVEEYEEDVDLAAFRDEYRDKVRELVAAKAEGKGVKLKKLRPRPEPEGSLADALEKSLAERKEARKSA
jgi:DNA end-binding protein Ku